MAIEIKENSKRHQPVRKKIFALIIFLNLLAILCFSLRFMKDGDIQLNISKIFSANDGIYSFEDPELALNLLKKFDKLQKLPNEIKESLSDDLRSILKDSHYCDKVRHDFVQNSNKLFIERNILSDHHELELIKTMVINKIGNDVGLIMNENDNGKNVTFEIPTYVSVFFMHFVFHRHYYLGKNYGCLNQMHNHIYDHTIFNKKSLFSQTYLNYHKNFETRPQCIPQFMPDSYLLHNKTQCLEFFRTIQGDQYAKEKKEIGIVFFAKIAQDVHKGMGVTIMDQKLEDKFKTIYNNGSSCGETESPIQMQKAVPNLLLLNGHKFDFRVYLLVASTNPLIAYYHDGFLKLSLYAFQSNSSDRNAHISNTHLAKKAFEKAREESWNGMNETELKDFQTWTFQRLQNFLIDQKYTTDHDWINNSLRKQLKEIMVHSLRMTQHAFLKRSQSFELFGCDFVLDTNLKAWLIEINTTPSLDAPSLDREKILVDMLQDMFKLMYGYLRSRMKRVIKYINNLTQHDKTKDFFGDDDINSLQSEFDNLNKNYLDPEFTISKMGFEEIVNENLDGTTRYSGILKKECL